MRIKGLDYKTGLPGEVHYLCSHCLLLPVPFNKKREA